MAAAANAKERFLREAQAAAAIEHEHVITIFQIGEERGVPFLAMPLLKGLPLDRYLQQTRPPAASSNSAILETVRIGREIAEGLAAAHALGMIHRDIKPANIWLEGTGAGSRSWILVWPRVANETVQLTQSGVVVVGTPAYMAPEQARGRAVDARADLFSLGCVLYELCTGLRPFAGADPMAILSALALDTPAAPHEVNPLVPAELSAVVMRLLEKEPDRRPASAAEVAAALADIEERQGPGDVRRQAALGALETDSHSNPPSTIMVSAGPRRGRRLRVLALFLGVLILIPLSWLGWDAWRGAPSATSGAVAPPGPRPFCLAFEGHGKVILPISTWLVASMACDRGLVYVDQEVRRRRAPEHYRGWSCRRLSPGDLELDRRVGLPDPYQQRTCHSHLGHAAAARSSSPRRHGAHARRRPAVPGRQAGGRKKPARGPRPSISPIILANASGKEAEGLCGQLFDVRFSKSLRYQRDFVTSPRLERDADTWALYPCDEGKDAKLVDASGNGHHGDIIGGTWQVDVSVTWGLQRRP